MTTKEALLSLNAFPIPDNTILKIGVDRVLDTSIEYTLVISISEAYELASADLYMYLYGQPSIVEQEVGINQAISIKKGFFNMANAIYLKYDDLKYTGNSYGFVGENYNG